MKIQYNFPNGYSAEMTNARETGDIEGWVDRKFGERIRTLISDDFTIDIQDTCFVVDFPFEDDGLAFLTMIGGRTVE